MPRLLIGNKNKDEMVKGMGGAEQMEFAEEDEAIERTAEWVEKTEGKRKR